MAQTVETDVLFGPFQVASLGAFGIVPQAHHQVHAVEQPWRLGQRQLAYVAVQHVLVKEGEGVAGVLQVIDDLRGAAPADMDQKHSDLGDTHFHGMLFVVKENEAPHPIDPPLRWFRSPEALQRRLQNLIEEARWRRWRDGLW
jgi:hypothetical protein